MLRSIRNFIITLLVSGAIFGFSAYFASNILIECMGPMFGITADNTASDKDHNNGQSDNSEESTTISDESSFSMLLINTNYKPSKASEYNSYDVARYPENENNGNVSVDTFNTKTIDATDFIIIRGDAKKKEFTYTYLPTSLVVTVKGKELSLNDVYRDLGITYLIKKISAITGFDIDFYSVYDVEDVSYIVEYISGVTYTVPLDIKTDSTVTIPKGSRELTGTEAQILLEYDGYSGTSQRSQTIISLIKKIMGKITNKIYKVDVIALHRSSSNKVDTTVGVTDINQISNLLYSYTTANIHEVSYPGKYKKLESGTVFIPNISSAINKFAKYR